MNRREFLSVAGASTAYSVMVNVNGWGAEPEPATPATNERFDQIAPAQPLSERFAGEPHLTLVDLACDLFVAGGGMSGVCARWPRRATGPRWFSCRIARGWAAIPPAK